MHVDTHHGISYPSASENFAVALVVAVMLGRVVLGGPEPGELTGLISLADARALDEVASLAWPRVGWRWRPEAK